MAEGERAVPDPENYDFALEDHISGEVGERVRSILSAAESAAEVIRHEADQEIAARKRIAEQERSRYLDAARQEADELLRRRIQRMQELSSALIEGAERLLGELDNAQDLRRQLDRTVAALVEAAARLSSEEGKGITPSEARPVSVPVEAVPEPDAAHEADIQDVEVAEAEEEPAEPPLRAAPEPEPAVAAEAEAEPEPEPAATEAAGNGARVDSEDDDVLAARLVALQMAVAGCPRGEVEEHLRVNFAVEDITSILNDVFGSDVPRIR